MAEQLIYELETLKICLQGSLNGCWLVRFVRMSRDKRRKTLDQIGAWQPRLGAWDRLRWHPVGSHLVPGPALRHCERWLVEQGVPGND